MTPLPQFIWIWAYFTNVRLRMREFFVLCLLATYLTVGIVHFADFVLVACKHTDLILDEFTDNNLGKDKPPQTYSSLHTPELS